MTGQKSLTKNSRFQESKQIVMGSYFILGNSERLFPCKSVTHLGRMIFWDRYFYCQLTNEGKGHKKIGSVA